MQLSEIFAKDIQRPIEGVIKADDVAHLSTEVEEYVLTNEAAKGLEALLGRYTSYTNANGVWISGFFGSGGGGMSSAGTASWSRATISRHWDSRPRRVGSSTTVKRRRQAERQSSSCRTTIGRRTSARTAPPSDARSA